MFVPLIFKVTEPTAEVTASIPAPALGVPSLVVTPMSARLSAALTRPVVTPAPIRVESTPIVTDVFVSLTLPGPVQTAVPPVPVIGTANVEKVPVTPRQPLF